jgi:5-methylcytosine-specific restriction endonuclease McrA
MIRPAQRRKNRKKKKNNKACKEWKDSEIESPTRQRKRIASFTVEEIREKLANAQYRPKDQERKQKPFFYHGEIRVSLRRTRIHFEMGLECVTCGRTGIVYHLEVTRSGSFHLDLYSKDDVLMTIDHIKARAKGGMDIAANRQMMCDPCNFEKADK